MKIEYDSVIIFQHRTKFNKLNSALTDDNLIEFWMNQK